MQDFEKLFEAYGADYKTTMARFMNRKEMYLRFLDMLFNDETMKKLGEAIDNEDVEAAFEAAHTLKGVVGNMGLTPLYNAVCRIVEPLRAREKLDDYPQMYQKIQEEFERADKFRMQLKGGE